jgi:DNA modification methylase
MAGSVAAMGFLDVPYNVSVRGIVGRGRTKHPEFRMGSGEMSPAEYGEFLTTTLGNARRVSRDGALHFVCCDWRHIADVLAAGASTYNNTINIAVWVKTNAGQGSFYRSAHEFIAVFRAGTTAHLNNIQLGRHGRSRSNVWRYAGVNTFRAGRMDELKAHPTAKPVALVADAMRDCTRRRDVVLDLFAGSGSTLLAAERVGRAAYAMEIEPRYVDVAIRRWQAFTRSDAVHAESGCTFVELAEKCAGPPDSQKRPAPAPSVVSTRRERRGCRQTD